MQLNINKFEITIRKWWRLHNNLNHKNKTTSYQQSRRKNHYYEYIQLWSNNWNNKKSSKPYNNERKNPSNFADSSFPFFIFAYSHFAFPFSPISNFADQHLKNLQNSNYYINKIFTKFILIYKVRHILCIINVINN